jgi:methyl-accepting chemotaxis protein
MGGTEEDSSLPGANPHSMFHAGIQLRTFAQIVENVPVRIILADRQSIIRYMNPASFRALRRLEHLLPCRADEIIGQSIDIFHKRPEHQRRIVSDSGNLPHRAKIGLGDEILDLNVTAIMDEGGQYLGPMVTWEVITEQEHAKAREEKLKLERESQRRDTVEKVEALLHSVQAAAQGDLTREITVVSDDDLGRLGNSMRKMFADLSTLIREVIEAAHQQNEGARTIAESSANLSEGAQTQAASVEEVTASMQQLLESVEVISRNGEKWRRCSR